VVSKDAPGLIRTTFDCSNYLRYNHEYCNRVELTESKCTEAVNTNCTDPGVICSEPRQILGTESRVTVVADVCFSMNHNELNNTNSTVNKTHEHHSMKVTTMDNWLYMETYAVDDDCLNPPPTPQPTSAPVPTRKPVPVPSASPTINLLMDPTASPTTLSPTKYPTDQTVDAYFQESEFTGSHAEKFSHNNDCNGQAQFEYHRAITFPYVLQWGAVLSSGFDHIAGDIFCKNVAKNYKILDVLPINKVTHPNLIIDEYIWITNVDCKGYEKSVWDCNNTLATELVKFDIQKHETIQVICTEAVDDCKPFSVMITEESDTEPTPRVIAPYFEPTFVGYEYIGCFEIGEEMHIEHWFEFNDNMKPSLCWSQCAMLMMEHESGNKVYNVFVIRKGAYCGCGEEEYGKYGLVQEDQCEVGCLGDIDDMRCGGEVFYSAFEIELFAPMFLEKQDNLVVALEQEAPAQEVEVEEEVTDLTVLSNGFKVAAPNTTIETVEGKAERQMQEAINRGLATFEFYRSQYPNIEMSADDDTLVLPTQRGFVVDPSATYKIWYGENLRRVHFDDNIGQSCVSLTVELHQHPTSWLDDEVMEYIDDGSSTALDYNQLFL